MNKKKQLKEKLDYFRRVTDGLGMPIDREVLKTVVLLNLLGFPTHQSCHGHVHLSNKEGLPYAWVNFKTPTEKEFRDQNNNSLPSTRHWYFQFQYEIDHDAEMKTREKFKIPQHKEINFSNKKIANFYDEFINKTKKEHKDYQRYREALSKIKEERKVVYQKIIMLMSEFCNNTSISLDEFTIMETLRIDFTSEMNSKNKKNLSLDEKFLIFKSSLEKLKLFEEFLLKKWNAS